MTDGRNINQRFQDYRPSKTALFWSCAGCIVATMIVGFTWGGWVTGGSAQDMAEGAAEQAQAQVAAAVCVETFMAAADARPQLGFPEREHELLAAGELHRGWRLGHDRR